jgi:hypothetical protein
MINGINSIDGHSVKEPHVHVLQVRCDVFQLPMK